MPARRIDPGRLLAAVNAQRQACGQPLWEGPGRAGALTAACASAVLGAVDAGLTPERDSVRMAVVSLLDALAAAAPGHSVEVRVPPHGAVQCLPGPRHTRGTPPNVIETDPVTWLRLATGRLPWAEAAAAGLVRASGPRASLDGRLPLALV